MIYITFNLSTLYSRKKKRKKCFSNMWRRIFFFFQYCFFPQLFPFLYPLFFLVFLFLFIILISSRLRKNILHSSILFYRIFCRLSSLFNSLKMCYSFFFFLLFLKLYYLVFKLYFLISSASLASSTFFLLPFFLSPMIPHW